MTGLSNEQLTELVARVHAARGGGFASRGRPQVLGLFGSVALVVCLMRKNLTQAFAGAIFGVSQSTVSRRWDLLRSLIGQVLAEFVPDPAELVGTGTVLVDGTVCPTWDWRGIPDLYSAKAGYPGMNIQIAATLSGRLAAVGLIPVHGARHDAHAFAASGLAALLADISTAADLGYIGIEGIEIVPIKRLPGGDLTTTQAEFNTLQQNPRCRRTRHRTPQDMANAQRGRRPLPGTDRKIPKYVTSRHRTLLLCGL
jgi:DDE superfamily endonuclease